jgi:hypothetical protein
VARKLLLHQQTNAEVKRQMNTWALCTTKPLSALAEEAFEGERRRGESSICFERNDGAS